MADHLFPLIERHDVADGTMAFRFDTTGNDFTFEAGQNCDFFLVDAQVDAANAMHTFSIASSPQEKDSIMIATRMRPSAFKNTLKDMPIGTKMKVVGPLGDMVLHEDTSRPAVFLAGGIGITPFRSMIADATERQLPHKIFLFYSNRNLASAPFHTDLEGWAAQNTKFHYLPALTDEQPADWPYEKGRIDETMLKKYLPDLQQPIFYLAGPEPMALAMKKMIKELGVSRDNIKSEEFTGY